ncbi:prepilin peptidase [Sphingomonas psychrotolerans]|uniref:Prepilin leader peptidase/N-methyltransferase n=1 Tax=Sphingomonas psychrotolerans TaxID=1327635 RepID=A0ABU3MZ32_9SPHN|nr:prepilin peptidase [Sphingomonas psychrotolerans]MDT8757555.1 prepilin peptidase [Sphingomonas psychrotolerans]
MLIDAWLWPVLLGALGLVFGSFIATVAIRWPQGRSPLRGRSACDSCGKPLTARELVPLASFLMQRGRCRGCSAPISLGHPLTEVLGLAIGVAAGLALPGVAGLAGAVFGWLLLMLAALDLTAFWLPNLLTGALAMAGLGFGLVGLPPPIDARLIGGVGGFAALAAVAAGYRLLRGRQGLGGGDPKLFGAIGCWLGWQALPLVLLAAALIGLAAVLGLYMGGRKIGATDRLPFGVMLAAAAFTVWIGQTLTPPPAQDDIVAITSFVEIR